MNEKNLAMNNIVEKEELRKVQESVLKTVSDAVMHSAGVYGSNTMIMRGNEFATYTKDGKKILENIKYFGQIENRIVDELFQIVSKVVKEVGDGTTLTTRLAYYIFIQLRELEKIKNLQPFEIIRNFNKMADVLAKSIEASGRSCELKDIYDIAFISTNGNDEVARQISDIYAEYGLGVNINVQASTTDDSMVKKYDGITLERGFSSPAFINTTDGKCILNNPRIYMFADGIDTKEMMGMFTRIIYDNIMFPFQYMSARQMGKKFDLPKGYEKRTSYVPTVIITPTISRDAAKTLEDLETTLFAYDNAKQIESKPPIAIISKLNRYVDDVSDLSILCGATPIRKYIDPSVQKVDIDAGKAPTIETVTDNFFGSTQQIIIDSTQTVFINPKEMYVRNDNGDFELDQDGNPIFSSAHRGLVSFFKSQIKGLEEEPEKDIVSIRQFRRRLNNLECNMVDYYIGGISISERESLKDLVEDAVLNCRSAARDGVGYGAGYMGLSAIARMKDNIAMGIKVGTSNDLMYVQIFEEAYYEMTKELYKTRYSSYNDADIDEMIQRSIEMGCPINFNTDDYDHKVLSSIMSDSVIIKSIAKVITIMLTANQAIIDDAVHNPYKKNEE